jgi:hypothetical protein
MAEAEQSELACARKLARVWCVCVATLACLAGIGVILWREDLRYALPTPRPPGLREPPLGSVLAVAWLTNFPLPAGAPIVLNFFNPACSCSRFNLAHLRELRARFAGQAGFVAVIESEEDPAALERRVRALSLNMPHLRDVGGKLAAQAGVYSTPQALVLSSDRRILYRGNYNLSRYCNDPRSEFVRLALESALATPGQTSEAAPSGAPAYGCELPSAPRAGAREQSADAPADDTLAQAQPPARLP